MNIGVLSLEDVRNYSLTGVMARGSGLKRDLRLCKKNSYSGYNQFFFKSYCGINGDSYDRYLIRMLEMGESLALVNTVASKLLSMSKNTRKYSTTLFSKEIYSSQTSPYNSMEDLISHFVN